MVSLVRHDENVERGKGDSLWARKFYKVNDRWSKIFLVLTFLYQNTRTPMR